MSEYSERMAALFKRHNGLPVSKVPTSQLLAKQVEPVMGDYVVVKESMTDRKVVGFNLTLEEAEQVAKVANEPMIVINQESEKYAVFKVEKAKCLA